MCLNEDSTLSRPMKRHRHLSAWRASCGPVHRYRNRPEIGVYFIAIIALAGGLALKLILPFIAWVALFRVVRLYLVPRLGQVAQEQAHARSSMTGRISDAHANSSFSSTCFPQ